MAEGVSAQWVRVSVFQYRQCATVRMNPLQFTPIQSRLWVGMGKGINRLSARFVATVKPSATTQRYHDGGGLYLQVMPSGAMSWLLRYSHNNRAREMGLGSATLFGLPEARERAQAARRHLADGFDPIEVRGVPRAAGGRTWGQAVDDFIAAKKAEWKGAAQAAQWVQSLKDHGPDRGLPVSAVTTELVLSLLQPLWVSKTETATRLRGRIERVWAAERVRNRNALPGENPALWKGHLEHLLPAPGKVRRRRGMPSMPWTDVPAFYRTLRSTKADQALKFTILTAARTSETTGLHMGEVRGELWTIPAGRMKAKRQHTVPLTAAALALLPKSGMPFKLSANGMLFRLQHLPPKGYGQPYTVHGFRSSFRNWAAEHGWPKDICEMALAHGNEDATEAAYLTAELLSRRRELMQAWVDYLA